MKGNYALAFRVSVDYSPHWRILAPWHK
jgi:hypothetical protein